MTDEDAKVLTATVSRYAKVRPSAGPVKVWDRTDDTNIMRIWVAYLTSQRAQTPTG